jgi:CheY-like chemotaxis protein/two-component sensor histidine kinase
LLLESASFRPRDVLREVADVMTVNADAKGITFKLSLPDDLPTALNGDATRLTQILTNLVSNAIKFTERGAVELSVHRVPAKSAGVGLCFVIRDTGIGIATEVQAQLFSPFMQADASITRRYGGTGLGLSIVKHMATLMGGEVAVASTPGVGSEFKVTLEFAPGPQHVQSSVPAAAAAAAATAGERRLAGVRVLAVDDSDINLDVAKRILELQGAQVSLAVNGQDAFECLRAAPAAFDVVLMDVQMPVLDGLAATRRIRVELGLVDLPIIALTAGALSHERPKALAAGMNDFITKPFDPEGLVRNVLLHARHTAPYTSTPLPSAAALAEYDKVIWPEIVGIDSSIVRRLLCSDVVLFRSLLSRLFSEFADVTVPVVGRDLAELAVHAQRMHKLKGCAGMLGATSIHQLAGVIVDACAAGEVQGVRHLATELASQLGQLRDRSDTALEAAAA